MHYYIVHNNSNGWEEYLKGIFSPIDKGSINGLTTNQAIYSTSFLEMYHYIMHDSSISYEEYLESFFTFSHLLIRALIKGLTPN